MLQNRSMLYAVYNASVYTLNTYGRRGIETQRRLPKVWYVE